jgi:hypothetical protein
MHAVCFALVAFLAFVTACGGGPDSESSYSQCYDLANDCIGDRCRLSEVCETGRCESEVSYYFASEEYESKCTYEYTETTTEYPLSGGLGRAEVLQQVEQCYYEVDIDYWDDDIDEEGRCTESIDCIVQDLQCDPSVQGQPDCEVVSTTACRR